MAKDMAGTGQGHSEPLAIVGFAFEFPSGITNPESFWEILVNGKIGLGDVPDDRFNLGAFHETKSSDNKSQKAQGYFIKNDISAFDAPFFSITAEEAVAMDPQQRLLLQTAYHAFENAGLTLDSINGSKTSVHVGCLSQDYKVGNNKDSEASPKYAATGDEFTILANRLSWFYNLNGPSMSVETACSSSLVALDLACQLLRSGDTDIGLVAGTSLIHQPDFYIHLDNMGFLSLDNRCHSFDSRANGYARAEGIGVVLVKRLSDAIRDGNTIRTVIRATGSNSDGHTPGITQPSGTSQLALIKDTYKKAGISMDETRYCEAHGTGTTIGDPTESHAIGAAFRAARSSEDPLYIGAVKANIGHMEAASGIAGIIKTVLVLERGVIPPIADLVELNPRIDHTFYKLKFPVEPIPWPTKGLRRASVNSFGYGGTNAHVVMDDAHNFLAEYGLKANHNTASLPPVIEREGKIRLLGDRSTENIDSTTTSRPYLLMLSAADREGPQRIANIYTDYLKEMAHPGDTVANSALCRRLAFTLEKRRSLLPWRGYTIIDPQQLSSSDSITKGFSVPVQPPSSPCLAFAFTGQGAQWARMGIQFMQYSVFARSIRISAKYLRGFGCSWDLEEELSRDASNSRVNDTDISQPLSTALQIALVDLLEHIKIRPAVVIGHSSGEVAAAYCKGALSQESALKIAYFRGMGGASEARDPNRNGTMIAVGLGEAEILPILQELAAKGYEDIYIGCMNSPSNVTVTGDADQLNILKGILDERGVFVRKVKVPCAYHSPHMIPIAKKYVQQAGPLERRDVRPDDIIHMISYVDGKHVSGERLRELDYWMTNLYSPVRFTENAGGIDRLAFLAKTKGRKKLDLSHRKGMMVTNILEIGPHGALRSPLREIMKTFEHASKTIKYDTVLVRGSSTVEPLLQAVGSLRCCGFNPDISYLNRDEENQETAPLVDLPSYPFKSSSYWAESRRSKDERFRRRKPSELLGTPTPDWQPFCGAWRNYLSRSKSTWMEDHKLDNVILYPGAGMVTMAIEAMNQYALDTLGIIPKAFCLADVEFVAAIQIPEVSSSLEVHTHLRVLGDSYKPGAWFEFTIYSHQGDLWKLNCRGRVRAEANTNSYKITFRKSGAADATTSLQVDEFYDKTTKSGYQFGPSFQRISKLQSSPLTPGLLQGVISVYDRVGPDSLGKRGLRAMDWNHIIHPATLDAVLQMTLANVTFTEYAQDSIPVMVPTKVKRLWISSTGLSHPDSSSLSVTTWCELSGYEHTIQVINHRSPEDIKVEITGLEMTIISSKADGPSNVISPKELHVCWNTAWKALPSVTTDLPSVSKKTELSTSIVGRQLAVEIYLPSSPTVGAVDLGTTLQLKLKDFGYPNPRIIEFEQATSVENSKADLKIILWDVDRESYLASLGEKSLAILKKVLDSRKTILWVRTSDSPSAHIVDGLSRVVRQEQNMSNFATISTTSSTTLDRTNAIHEVIKTLLSEQGSGDDIPQSFRETSTGGIEVCLLKENKELTKKIQSVQRPAEPTSVAWDVDISGPLKVAIAAPGDLSTIHFVEDPSPGSLGVSEIEVEVKAVGLNFKDCLAALGTANEKSIGSEIAGVVTRTGLNVKHFRPGNRVCGFATNGVRTLFRNNAQLFSLIPDSLTFTQAASIPVNFATALYTLQTTARVAAGETVLIHRGSSGTGQAAIQAALHLGATIFATAGTPEKRELLTTEYGIPQTHIFSSRDNNFVAEIQCLTKGRGVDVVLNSLAGEQLTGSWECIAPFGRFIEIGRQGVPAGAQLEKNCSFTTADLAHMYRERPLQASKMIGDALSLFEKGVFRPLQFHQFPVSEVIEALKLIRGRNMSGKIVVNIERSMKVQAILMPKKQRLFFSDASYVIAGGLGGLGCDIARWMVDRGARHLILLSRSGARTETARALLTDLKNLGVNCVTPACDISSFESVKETLESLVGVVPQVKGCIQASMVLRSALFSNMTHSEWSEALAPKASGSWNLHALLPEDMDFFILLSSIQGLMGPRTQGNYAAGNTYKDALAQYRISRGLKAVSLQLGLMDSDGYMAAAENEDEKRMMMAQNSFVPVQRLDFHALLEHYCDATIQIQPDQAQLALGIKLLHVDPDLDPLGTSWGRDPMFQELRRLEATEGVPSGATNSKETVIQLAAARSDEEAADVVIKALTEKLASIVYANGADADNIDRRRPVQAYGVDSLQTMELRGWFLKTFRSDVPTFEILGAPSLNALALIIGERSTLRIKSP
ncbi:hypothetical protein AOL_s00043g828 [Orbilia oligospora ATCC 24927]|uniref:Uncharacterized protein n=1 Tax=Arthrobotrys oligospora (strain ATCC 24927 / CBS 115.81 / DSM 1491) TaxID=756982 RepID=G1X554_ARTOA|nr:hypothetical protein AOL_s00043g828 [Orbilia oligospora ATCC 24927]EGX51809.1 hypothetical protein AOL_s00043g828 [Orbilia oligospora ATCC 24927]